MSSESRQIADGTKIAPSAVIMDGAVIGPDCEIGPFSVIGPQVVMGAGNWVGSHVVIEGATRIGDRNRFFQFGSIGAIPQDLKYHGEQSALEIGNENIFREYVTLQPGTEGGGMITSVGDQNLFMASSHLGHDGKVGNGNIFANCAALAGHVTVGDRVTVGGLSGIHQFVHLGDHALLGGGAMVNKDIPPFCIAQGDRARLAGVNVIGLERAGFSADAVKVVRRLYRRLFLGSGAFSHRLSQLSAEVGDGAFGEEAPVAERFISFIAASERGVAGVRRDDGE